MIGGLFLRLLVWGQVERLDVRWDYFLIFNIVIIIGQELSILESLT
jgi:hypothetical protein